MQRVDLAFSDRPHIADYPRYGRLAEELGYHTVWVTEPRLARDGVSAMAVLCATTDRLGIGSAVLNNWTRAPALTAVTVATLDALAPGRVTLGLGAYWDPLARNQGIVRRRPLQAMREYVDIVRQLLALQRVTYHGEIFSVQELELDAAHATELGYGELYSSQPIHIPIMLGATGPKMLELAGEIADGVILTTALSLPYVTDAMARLRASISGYGKQWSDFQAPKIFAVALDDGSGEAWEATRRKIVRYLGQQPHVQKASGLPAERVRAIQDALGGWPPKPGGLAAASRLVPDEAVRAMAIVGTPEQCRDQIREYLAAGVSYPILKIESADMETAMRSLAPSTWGS